MFLGFLPHPVSWLRAIAALLITSLLAAAIRISGTWAAIAPLNNYQYTATVLAVSGGFTTLVVCLLHHFLVGRSPQGLPPWVPGWRSVRAGLTAMIVIVVSTSVSMGLLSPFLRCFQTFYGIQCENQQALASWGAGIWLTVAAYLYQYDYLVRRRRQRKQGQNKGGNAP